MTSQTAPGADQAVDRALALISALADDLGPRRPTGRSGVAAELVREQLRAGGVAAASGRFAGYSTFAEPYGLPRSPACRQRCRGGGAGCARVAALAAAGLISEGGLVHTPLRAPLAAPERQRRGDDRAARGCAAGPCA